MGELQWGSVKPGTAVFSTLHLASCPPNSHLPPPSLAACHEAAMAKKKGASRCFAGQVQRRTR